MAADLGCTAPISGDLTSWAQQGVLLLNTTLTVREHAANSHAKLGWKTLTDAIVRLCLQLEQPVVFLTWGRHAIDMVEAARKATGASANKFFLPLRTPRRSLPRAPQATFPPSWVRAPSRAPMSCLPSTVPPPSIGAPSHHDIKTRRTCAHRV